MERYGINQTSRAKYGFSDWHLVPRAEGQRLLFGAAVDLARQKGVLNDNNPASFELSRLSAGSYALVDHNARLITRIPVPEARKRLQQRHRSAHRLLGRPLAKLPKLVRQGSTGMTVNLLRLLDDEPRALAWAIGSGEPFPDNGPWLQHALITVGLLCLCVVPGLWYVSLRSRQTREHRKAMQELVARWRSLGRPDPPTSFFALYGHGSR